MPYIVPSTPRKEIDHAATKSSQGFRRFMVDTRRGFSMAASAKSEAEIIGAKVSEQVKSESELDFPEYNRAHEQ